MKKIIALIICAITLSSGFLIAYDTVKRLNIARCLGCIAMYPKAIKFSFWVEYPKEYKNKGLPPHPEWIVNESKVILLFLWGYACEPCEKQWEEMKKAGIVEGTEENGTVGGNFSYVKLYAINGQEEKDLVRIYNKRGEVELPTTVILFKKNETIYWYAFSGPADGKGGRPNIEELIKILEMAKEEKNVL